MTRRDNRKLEWARKPEAGEPSFGSLGSGEPKAGPPEPSEPKDGSPDKLV